MRAGSPGHFPSPVYEAHLSDGEIVRLSFWSPSKAPVDFALGRAAVEEIALADPRDERRVWFRDPVGGFLRARWGRRIPARSPGKGFAAWSRAVELGKCPRAPVHVVRGFVEHHTLGGKVEDTPENRSFRGPAPAPVRVNWKVRAEAALLELQRGDAQAALAILQVGQVMAEAA